MQIRALAWGLRDISNAAYITPDADAMKSYFTTILDNNLDALINNYVNGPLGDKEGQLEGWISQGYDYANSISPWQQDYLATSLQDLSEKGFTKADTMLGWMDNFLSGRFTQRGQRLRPAPWRDLQHQVYNPATGQLYQTWQEVYQATLRQRARQPKWTDGPAGPPAMPQTPRPALASVISSTQSPDAIEAYGWLQSQTTAMIADYAKDPTWNIAPTLANGQYLTNDEIHVHTATTAATLTAGSAEAMLIGNLGNDTIVGGSGIGMLFGMDGNDTITAGSGNSYLYGGDGNDRLVDGAGDNYFKGGAGADVFAFNTGTTGRDIIDDFTKGVDRIEIKGGGFTAADLVAQATADANGNAVLHLGSSHDIVLQGVLLGNVTQDIFTIA